MKPALRRRLLRVLDRTMVAWMRHAPPALAHGAARRLGRLAGQLYPNQVQRVRENLAALRPDLPPEAALSETMENLARTLCEASIFPRFWDEGRVEVLGVEHLAAKPALLVGLHTGGWPLLGAVAVRHGHRVIVPHQPPADPFRARIAMQGSEAAGLHALTDGPDRAARMARALLQGETVLLYLDEHLDGRVAAPSLGRGPRIGGNIEYAARLARLSGLAPIFLHCERIPGGRAGPRFLIHVAPPLALPRGGNREADLRAGVAMLDAAIEPALRRLLTQWLMLPDFRFQG